LRRAQWRFTQISSSIAAAESEFCGGARQDVLRRVDGALRIASRRLILDQNVILAENVSVFF